MKKSKITVVSIALNVIFIFLFVLFAVHKGGINYFKNKIAKHSNNYSLYHNVGKSVFAVLPNNNSDILFVGDSLTNYCDWNELLQNNNIKNRGIPGDRTQDLLDDINIILKDKPKKIFLMIGINDLSNGAKQDVALSNYRKIILRIKKSSPNTNLIIQSLLPINENILVETKTNNKSIMEFNNSLKELAKNNNLKYIDLYSHFLKNNELDKSLTVDGLHLNGKGYLVWKQIIQPNLQ